MDRTLPEDSLRRSAVYWLEWNRLIERNYPGATRVRLEDLNMGEVVRALGFSDQAINVAFDALKKKSRQKAHVSPTTSVPDVTWQELRALDKSLADQVLEQASRYGYNESGVREQTHR